ncbi:MAG: DNA recombination protein RmuC [Akkermansiaceae bacterium]
MPAPEYLPYISAAIALFIGILTTWLILSSKSKASAAVAASELQAANARADETSARLAETHASLEQVRGQYIEMQNKEAELRLSHKEVQVRLQEEQKSAAEKQKLLAQTEARLTDTFKALSADALKSNQEQFLSLAKNSLKNQQQEASHELEKRKTAVEQLVKPISQTLEKVQHQITESEKLRASDKASLKEQIVHIAEANHGLQKETHKLVKALRQPTGRGQWGEMQLKRVVEMAGMQEHCDFETQTSTTGDDGKRLRPDLIVKLPGGQQIVVDSKAPMDAYLDAIEAEDEGQRETAMARHAAQVRTHIQQLSSKKYQEQFESTPEFVVLFLPSEAFFSAALSQDSSLIEKGVDQGVILSTPTTLIALLRAVAFGWRQEALAENAREISSVGRELYSRIGTFAGHVQKMGRSLNTAVADYNKTVGSLETRILTGAKKLEALGAAPDKAELPETKGIESLPRDLRVELPAPVEDPVPSGEEFAITSNSDSEFEGFGAEEKPAKEADPNIKGAADDFRAAFE